MWNMCSDLLKHAQTYMDDFFFFKKEAECLQFLNTFLGMLAVSSFSRVERLENYCLSPF